MEKIKNSPKVLIIHGPNLNMLGKREPDIYGKATLGNINNELEGLGQRLGLEIDIFQSNHEGKIVEKIQEAMTTHNALIINPAAYTHTSIAIRDALLLLDMPVIEVHLSNIYKREPFRRKSMIADIATARICGFGTHGYSMALEALAGMIRKEVK
ncbi:type II 3-dehydroquinate dehydratase [Thermodesulfobacteriota bacterium]